MWFVVCFLSSFTSDPSEPILKRRGLSSHSPYYHCSSGGVDDHLSNIDLFPLDRTVIVKTVGRAHDCDQYKLRNSVGKGATSLFLLHVVS